MVSPKKEPPEPPEPCPGCGDQPPTTQDQNVTEHEDGAVVGDIVCANCGTYRTRTVIETEED